MLFFTSIPFFLLNITFVIILTGKLSIARAYSDYKPRFDFFMALIWSYIPLSFFSALNDLFGGKLVYNYNFCSSFTFVAHLSWISYFATPILSLYLLLLIFTEKKLNTINKIGFAGIIILLIIVFVSGYTFSIVLGVTKSKYKPGLGFTECTYSADQYLFYGLALAYSSQGIVLLFIVFIIFYDRILRLKVKRKNLKLKRKENSKMDIKEEEEEINSSYKKIRKIHMMRSFLLIVISTMFLSVAEKIVNRLTFIPSWIYSIFVDLMRIKPFIYSIIILVCDKSASIKIHDYPIKKILEISELTKILENFINSKRDKKLKELYEKIKSAYLDLENEHPKKEKVESSDQNDHQKINKVDLEILEKEIWNHGFCEFYLSDEFIYFLWKFQNVGMIDMEIGNKVR